MQETDAQTDQTPPPADDTGAAPQQAEPVTSDIPGEAAVTPPVQATPAQGESGLSEILAVDGLRQRGLELWAWTQENILTLNMLIQLGLLSSPSCRRSFSGRS